MRKVKFWYRHNKTNPKSKRKIHKSAQEIIVALVGVIHTDIRAVHMYLHTLVHTHVCI